MSYNTRFVEESILKDIYPYQPIIDFLDTLRADGFELGVDNYLAIAQVWQRLPAEVTGEQLLAAIAPLVVRSAAEQQRFWDRKEDYLRLLAHSLPIQKTENPVSTAPQAKGDQVKEEDTTATPPARWPYVLGTVLVVILLAVVLWYVKEPVEVADVPDEPPPLEATVIPGCRDTTALNYDPTATADCDNCCIYERIGCMDDTALNFDPRATQPCEDCCQYGERDNITKLVQADSVSWRPPPLYFESTLPPLTPLATSGWYWLSPYKDWLSLFIPAFLIILVLGWWLWQRKRQQFVARQRRNQDSPYRLPIKIHHEQAVKLDERFFLLLDRLRSREAGERSRINMPATIKATARGGGFPSLRFRPFTRPTEYLILIDQQTKQGHQSQLFEYIFQHFVRKEVQAERFFFDGRPTTCWNDRYPEGLSLTQLRQRYSEARLLILADGYSFLNPASGELEPWVQELLHWQQRALLTPAPTGDWNYREATLSEAFLTLPNSVGGMLELVQYFEERATPTLREWKYELEPTDKLLQVDEDRLVADLEAQLPPHLLSWVAACALYTELHWDLTLAIGRTLRGETEPEIPFADLRLLARLPWFKRGYMPQEVRSALLDSGWLSTEEEQHARQAIVTVLLANVPNNKNSYAYDEHQLHLALNKLLVSQLPEERRQWLERYRELHQRGVREDIVSEVALDRQYNRQLDFPLPQQLMELFFSGGRFLLGLRSAVPVIVAVVLGSLGWLLVQQLPDPCTGRIVQLPGDEKSYCLSDETDSLRYWAHLGSAAIADGQLTEVFTRVGQATTFADTAFAQPEGDRLLRQLFIEPVFAHLWNEGSRYYQADNFTAALEFYRNYHAMANNRENKIPTTPEILPARERFEWLGLCSVFIGDEEGLLDIRNGIAQLGTNTSLPHPNLSDYLRYAYVDSASYGRIRVRNTEARYGYLRADSGAPTWTGAAAPYDFAESYRLDTLSGDTLAMIYHDGLQCLINLNESLTDRVCFTKLTRFQHDDTGLYGFENENRIAIIPAQFTEAGEFTADDLAWVKRPEEGYGYVQSNGSKLLGQNNLQAARDFRYGRAAVQRNDRWGFLDVNGQVMIELRYSSVADFTANGRAKVNLAGRSFVIDREGRCVGGDCPMVSYRGRVMGSLTNKPMAAVTLQIEGLTSGTITTDAEGYYTFRLPEGTSPAGRQAQILSGDGPLGTFRLVVADPAVEPVLLQTYTVEQQVATAPDDDQDGVPNTEDRCPKEAGLTALRGCPDEDGDGVADIDDRCRQEPGVIEHQGCPPPPTALDNFVRIPGGTFQMGDVMGDNEQNDVQPHPVTVATFYLSPTEVTFAEYDAFCTATGREKPADRDWGRGQRPAINVSWCDAVAYANWLSTQNGLQKVYNGDCDNISADWSANGYRLPTEAEWEYAARQGGQKVRFGNGKDIADPTEINFDGRENYKKTYSVAGIYRGKTVPVGSLSSPNSLGLHDMSGNVYEWCWDWYDGDYYKNSPQQNPRGPSGGSSRVLRGGGWFNYPLNCRAADRYFNRPSLRSSNIGFRLARSF